VECWLGFLLPPEFLILEDSEGRAKFSLPLLS
jgi:hypothetical protein